MKTRRIIKELNDELLMYRTADEFGITKYVQYSRKKKKIASFNLTEHKLPKQSQELVRQLQGFSLIAHDLQTVVRWQNIAAELQKTNPYDPWAQEEDFQHEDAYIRSLFVSSVVTYGKCFARGGKRGPRLSKKQYINRDFADLHDRIIACRNKYVAHSDSSIYENAEIILLVGPRERTLIFSTNLTYTHSQNYFGNEFVYLAENVLQQVDLHLANLNEKLRSIMKDDPNTKRYFLKQKNS